MNSCAPTPAPSAGARVIFAQDLSHRSPGPYGKEELREDFNAPTWSAGVADGRVSVVDAGGGSRALAVAYPAACAHPCSG